MSRFEELRDSGSILASKPSSGIPVQATYAFAPLPSPHSALIGNFAETPHPEDCWWLSLEEVSNLVA